MQPVDAPDTACAPRVRLAPAVGRNVARVTRYVAGPPARHIEEELGISAVVNLSSNENALGPSPKAIRAMRENAVRMSCYPDAASRELRDAVADRQGVTPDMIVFGAGSDEIIHFLGVTFLSRGDEVIVGKPSFARYLAAATLADATCHSVPVTDAGAEDLDGMAARVTARTRIVFIASPNNPTGAVVGAHQLQDFVDWVPDRVIAVLDEAYYEYARADPDLATSVDYVRRGYNVVVLRTFSKAYGLAGLRIGYGIMRREIADWVNRVREPFNVNAMAQAAAIAALDDGQHMARTLQMNEEGKLALYAAFDRLGLPYFPTHANFIWLDVGRDSSAVCNELRSEGILVRSGDAFGCNSHVRVTIGSADQNARFVSALQRVLTSR